MPPGARLISSRVTGALLFAGGLLLSSAAQAQLVRYVSATGNDANPCITPAAPCRTLQRGITFAPTGGEVKLLASVDGDATIDHSLTISGGGFTVTGSIVVNNASATVVLRDLNLFGAGAHDLGVYVTAASSVHVLRCTVERFTEYGIASEAPNAEIFMTESISRDNGYAGLAVAVLDSNFASRLVVDGSRFLNNAEDGVHINRIEVTFTRSIMSGNHAGGITMSEATGAFKDTVASDNQLGAGFSLFDSEVTLESSVSRGNTPGLFAFVSDEPLFVTISNSVFTSNRFRGISTEDTVKTRGNNTVSGNETDISGTLTPVPAY